MELRDHQGLTAEEFLKSYDAGKFERPSVTVDTAIFTITGDDEVNQRNLSNRELQVLLIKRGGHPFLGQWALPGGFVNPAEDIDQAAVRELKEETNLDCSYMEQLYTWGEVNRDPRTRVISISYLALLDSTKFDIQAGDDAADAKWYTVKDTVLKKKKL
ncbi:NUDIX hydrolase [Desulfosporosinus sp. OT]|uniref:NUDIX domain-containing protein n=1 Tax=Desulfosporosinus sp. OT TaxID=913865 RepID=UPI000223AE6D|nr:NUDIX domain protein [Desulfosporosinus sp. OT]